LRGEISCSVYLYAWPLAPPHIISRHPVWLCSLTCGVIELVAVVLKMRRFYISRPARYLQFKQDINLLCQHWGLHDPVNAITNDKTVLRIPRLKASRISLQMPCRRLTRENGGRVPRLSSLWRLIGLQAALHHSCSGPSLRQERVVPFSRLQR
jgi:hypothetical protein